jgi:precorrin-3 C-17 methylase
MAEADIGMLSTVLIGNSHTFTRHGLMVTPRGYANKYGVSGEGRVTHEGEKAGRSLSSGLDGWLQSLREDLAAGHSLQALAARDGLPADYLQAALADPPEDAAAAETGQD